MWEHLVLDTLRTAIYETNLYYWRDKSGREIDFIIKRSGQRVDAIECKISEEQFDNKSFFVFRSLYPEGNNYVISPFNKILYKRIHHNLEINYCSLNNFPFVSA